MKIINLFVIILFFSCTFFEKKEVTISPKKTYPNIAQNQIDLNDLKSIIGFVKCEKFDDFNNDSLIINNISISVKKFISNEKYTGFTLNEDYYLFFFRCVGKNKLGFEVITNEENGEKGILKTSKNWKFYSIQEFIINLFAVGFNEKTNPIHDLASSTSTLIMYDENENYYPVKIKGDWLQIKWGEENNYRYGWIRWRENNKLIIEMFFYA